MCQIVLKKLASTLDCYIKVIDIWTQYVDRSIRVYLVTVVVAPTYHVYTNSKEKETPST